MDGYTGYITLFAGTFAPLYWAFCDGSQLQIQQYAALYSLIGTTYGGDGRTTFNLPDLRGRAVVGAGQGPGLRPYNIGQRVGAESVALTLANIQHNHGITMTTSIPVNAGVSGQNSPVSAVYGYDATGNAVYSNTATGYTAPMPLTITTNPYTNAGGAPTPMNTRGAALVLSYIICLDGTYPPPPPDDAS